MQTARSLVKRLYEKLPFKRSIYTVVRSIGTPPERIHRHLHFKGIITVPVSGTEQFRVRHHGYMIENELFWKGLGGWEKVSMELWMRLSRRSSVILDIGANTGIYALVASAVNPDAKVVAVEPVARIFEKLQENIALNGDRIRAVHAAVSDHTGTAILFDQPEQDHVLSVSLDPEWNKTSSGIRPVEVPCITVTDLLAQQDTARVDLLKIDVETHEASVLRGFLPILRKDRPTLLIELLNDKVASEVAELIDGLGYLFFNIDDMTWPPPRTETLTKSGHFNFLICTPETAEEIGL